MKKKVKDLTLKEIENICMKNHNYKDECLDTCPFSENASACWIACALNNYLDNMDAHTIRISDFNRLITTSECSVPIMFSLKNDDDTMNRFKNYCEGFSTFEIRKYNQILKDAKQKLEYCDNIRKELEDNKRP